MVNSGNSEPFIGGCNAGTGRLDWQHLCIELGGRGILNTAHFCQSPLTGVHAKRS